MKKQEKATLEQSKLDFITAKKVKDADIKLIEATEYEAHCKSRVDLYTRLTTEEINKPKEEHDSQKIDNLVKAARSASLAFEFAQFLTVQAFEEWNKIYKLGNDYMNEKMKAKGAVLEKAKLEKATQNKPITEPAEWSEITPSDTWNCSGLDCT